MESHFVNMNTPGGKGASLEKIKEDYNVPKFTILSSNYFDDYLEFNNIKMNLSDLKLNNVTEVSKNYKERILLGNFNIKAETDIINMFNLLNVKKISVRSSAIVEDANNNSWAGLFDSHLFVNKNKLMNSIKKVYASLFNERALQYKVANNIPDTEYKMAVVLQEMVDGDASGVSFSKDIVSNTDCILIESCLGTGDMLVSGNINPDNYLVKNKTIIKKINSQKLISKNNRVKTINNSSQKITDKQILNVAKATKAIARKYKFPVDIEFCYKNNLLYILQVRPITSKFKTSRVETLKKYLELNNFSYPTNSSLSLLTKTMSDLANNELYSKIVGYSHSIQLYTNKEYYRIYNGNRPDPNYTSEEIVDLINESNENTNSIISQIDFNMFNSTDHNIVKKNVISFLSKYLSVFVYEANIRYILDNYYKSHEINNDNLYRVSSCWRNEISHEDVFTRFISNVICYYGFREYKDLLLEFISYDEFINMLENNYNIESFAKRMQKRKANGYVFLNIPFKKVKLIDNKRTVEEIKKVIDLKYFNNYNDIKGSPVILSKQIITGECIVIKQDIDLNPTVDLSNKIVVSTMTTPYFIPYINNIKGIITDTGGILCHASIISREKNIPTIVGTVNATKRIHTGQVVKMNMATGIVEIN